MHTKHTTKITASITYIYMYVIDAVCALARLFTTPRAARAFVLACVCVCMFLGGAPKADAAITYYGSTSTPVDNGTANEPNVGTTTPPSGMTTGDLVFLIAQSDADNMTMLSTGGQSWTQLTSGGAITDTTTYGRVWWARYNGTWSTNPAIDFAAAGGTNPSTVVMHVFRPTDTTKAWFVDQGFTELDFAAAATITITGQTTVTSENTVTLAGWLTSDDNSWGTISGTGWVVAGNAQYRNLGGNDQSAAFAYKIQSSAGATGNVALTQTANGNDSGTTFIVTLREQVPTTLSGTLYSDEGFTPITGGKTVAAAIGTTTTSLHSATTDGSGAFSITLDASNTIGSSTPIVLWVDQDTSTRAALFTKASSTNNITGLNLYQNRVIISHEGTSGTSTTISNMSFYDTDNDSDIQYRAATSSSGNVLTVFTNQELYVKSEKTFAPGGDVTVRGNGSSTSLTDGSLRLPGTATYTAGGATMLAGSFRASSTATFTHNDYITIFNATTTGKTVVAPITSLGNVYFSGTRGAFTFSADATTTNLHIGSFATVTAPSTLVVQGDYVNAGEFIHNNGTVIVATTTTGQLVGGRTATSSPFYNLTLSGNNAVRSGGYYTVPTTTNSFSSVVVDATNGVLYSGAQGSSTANAFIVRCVISSGCDQAEDFVIATTTQETTINDLLVDETNGVLYGTTYPSGFILRCALSTGCDGGTDFTVATDTSPEYLVSLDIDTANQVLYAGSYGTGLVYRCALSTGCDGGTDFILAADLNATGMFGLSVDETNGRLYVASGGTGVVFYCLLSSSCDQTTDFSTATDTPETTFYDTDIDDDNGVMYLGAGNNGRLYRCVLSTGCDGVGEYTVPFDHATEQVVYEVLVDEDNDILYLTTFGAGAVYTCLLATSCDEQTDFIYATNTAETSIRSLAFDTKTDTLYLPGSVAGRLFVCPLCHAVQSTTTSVTNLTIGSSATYAQNYETRISGNYTNNGVSLRNIETGTPSMAFVGTSPQTISGNLTGSSTLPSLLFTGAGTKTFSNAASTTDVTIGSGAGEVTTPSSFTIAGNLEQGGTLTANASTIYFTGNVGSSTKVGGDSLNSSWVDSVYEYVWSMIEHNGKLYAGLAQSAGDAEVWEYDGSSWTMIGGDAINSSWADATYDSIFSMASFNGKLYAGLGQHTGEAEVWEYNGSSWTKVGGDAVNSSWPDATHQRIPTMAVYNDKLYAGLGNTDAEVWEYNGSSWTQVAGDSLNSSWASAAYARMSTLVAHSGKLYAGLGSNAGDADVWEYNGSSWTQVGGDALNSSWAAATYETIYSFTSYNGKLYTGLGLSTGDAEVWEYNGSSWRMVGGDGLYLSWPTDEQNGKEILYALLPFSGKLYAGLGSAASDGEVWEYDGYIWRNVAGNSGQNGTWFNDDAYYGVYSLGSYQNALYAGTGGVAGAAEVWRLNPATLSGTLAGNSRLGAVTIDGSRVFSSVASTSHFTVRASSTVTAPSHLTISGDYANSGTYTAGGTTTFSGSSAQSLSGNMTATSTFNHVAFTGAGTKTFSNNASTSNFMIESGSSVTAPSSLTISSNFRNSGTFTAGGTTTLSSTTAQNATGTMTASNGFNTLVLSGMSAKTFGANASTTNLVIETNATAVLPPLLSISGNYTNNGTTTAGSGTTTFNGTTAQTATGTMTGTSAFYNLEMINTTGGSSSPAIVFGNTASTTGTLFMRASSSAAFFAGATSTFQNIHLAGSSISPVFLRSTLPGTQWGMNVPGTQHLVTYVDVRDSNACSGNPDISAVDGTSVNAGGNTCWNFGNSISMASAANQTFTYGDGATTIETITVIDDSSVPTMTAANDIRIKIATSTVRMLWDTTDTTATFGGTASGKVSNTVSYEGGGSVLVIDVTTNFAAGDTLTISGLSFANFTVVNSAATALSLYTGGAGDTSADYTDSATVAILGSFDLDAHTLGQVQDSFSPVSDTNVELFAFSLASAGESMNVTSLVISIRGVTGVTESDLTNMVLYRDLDGDKNYDPEDVAIGGSGAVSIGGQTGSVTFSSAFSASTTQNYILVGDVNNIMPTDSVVFGLSGSGIVATGASTSASIVVSGSVGSIQHIKGGAGAGGSAAAIGGAAPAGDGVRTGGNQGGGESIDPNSGSTIGNETGFNPPSANGAPLANSWTNPGNAYASDGSYATVNSSASQGYGNFGFSVPSNNTITGIGIKIEASGSTAAGTISARITWDAGSSFTSYETTGTLNVTDGVYELGGPSNTWGRSWTPAELSNSTFAIEILGNPSANTISVDALQVRVYHQATGGGGGGGGRASIDRMHNLASVIAAFSNLMDVVRTWFSW